jgi:hypothetical protein
LGCEVDQTADATHGSLPRVDYFSLDYSRAEVAADARRSV